MPDREPIFILRTKLYRPPVADDVVCRQALHERLTAGLDRPLALVSAPAGYGKSTLVSHWLESIDHPRAWLSLEESDSDPAVFLQYLVAALRSIVPDPCPGIMAILDSTELPSAAALGACLANDLAGISEPFVLVLDDYHRLGASPVHELFATLLDHPPRALHLVLVTRRNPPLPSSSLRAQGRMTEVRLRDLEFTQGETTALLEQAVGERVGPDALAHVHKRTEGWPVALRMAILAMQYHEDPDAFLQSFDGNIHQVQEYLMAEVMEHEDPVMRDRLCKIAILDRFSAPLCAAVCDVAADADADQSPHDLFVTMLERSGLLCIALDGSREWFRFHHLFRELLRQQLVKRFDSDSIAAMHGRAAEWLEAGGFLEEATQHLVAAGNVPAMRALIFRNRRMLYQTEQWLRFDALLNNLPVAVVNEDADLLMIKAWIDIIRQRHTEIWALVARAEVLLAHQPCTDDMAHVFGQIDIFKSWRDYASGDGAAALACAESAVTRLPMSFDIENGYAKVMVSVSLQMVGREAEGLQYIYDALEKDRHAHPSYRVRLLEALGFVLWMGGDLAGLRDAGAAMIRLGEKASLPVTVYNGHYQMGKALYALGKLEEARKILSAVIKPGCRATDRFLIRSSYFLALTCEALGESERASSLLDTMVADLLDDSNSFSLAMVKVFQAELALRQGRQADAEGWLATFTPSPTPRGDVSSNDELTAAWILLSKGSPSALKKAGSQLAALKVYFEKIHNTRFLIEALALQSLVYEAQDKTARANTCLEKAITMAHPRGFIRLFVDMGPAMSRLLNRLALGEDALEYVGRIQAAFRGARSPNGAPSALDAPVVTQALQTTALLDPLTKREQEILALLAMKLTNQEIAARLYISTGTVKRHTNSLYSKLGVHGRREAVAKATGLGILELNNQ